ncbi:PREDICTED: uncharacterized protein LOC105455194 [Wasmannia auropunctata]|uniref:uncharacterized protein LOC105455194 n=1 Tax=Wasmannia auropunctata TaxID=64793 RepID=UPI0005EE9901|nr:PREDICTED: uncharacterized protein LOC105455194 [Wasmannia auropunctata]
MPAIRKFSRCEFALMYGLKVNSNFMMWTCWTIDLSSILRRVIVKTNMEIKVFIGEKEVSFDIKMIQNIREIDHILKKLEIMFPCETVNNENRVTNCQGFVIKEKSKIGQRMRCLACTKNWKILLRKSQNLTPIEKLRKKNKKLNKSNLYY